MNQSMVERITEYIRKKYYSEPEYLWKKYPEYFIFRRNDNQKWFAAVMRIKKNLLVENADGMTDIIDVKCETGFKDLLISSKEGYYPAYHMNKEHWVTIVLDGTADENEIFSMIDESFSMTGNRSRQSNSEKG